MKFYNIFTESVDALKLDNTKSALIKKLAKAIVESIEPGGYKVVKHLDNGRSIIVYEKMETLKNGVSSVTFSKKHYNVIDMDGTQLYDTDFDTLGEFNSNLILVSKGQRWNVLNANGDLVSNVWFDGIRKADNGLSLVYKSSKRTDMPLFNFINEDGELVSEIWFDSIYSFDHYGSEYVGLYRVAKKERKMQCNVLRNDGMLLSEAWYDDILPEKDGLFTVQMNNQYNFMNMYGNLICEDWFQRVYPFSEGFAKVTVDGRRYLYINKNGEYLSENTFWVAHNFSHGVALVSRINDWQSTSLKYNYINTNGDFISDIDFDWADDFDDNGLGRVTKHIDRRKIDENGNLSESDVVKVNLINEHGDYLLDKWVDEICPLSGRYHIFCNNQDTFVDADGNMLRDWMDI